MKRPLKLTYSALLAFATLAIAGTLVAQAPPAPQPEEPAKPAPADEKREAKPEPPATPPSAEPAPAKPEAPAPAKVEPVPAKPAAKDPRQPGAKEPPPDRAPPRQGPAKPEKDPKAEPKPDAKDPTDPDAKEEVTPATPGKSDPRKPEMKEPETPKGNEKAPDGRPKGKVSTEKVPDPKKMVEPKAGEELPAQGDAALKVKYDALEDKDGSFEDFRKAEQWRTERLQLLKANPARRLGLKPKSANLHTACGNGDFESGMIDPNEWTGADGGIIVGTGPVDFANFITGIQQGAINLQTSHQTITNAGQDPNAPIQQTGPAAPNYTYSNRSQHAVRIGNAYNSYTYGAELLSKTFSVTPNNSIIRFWYAVVLQDPGHLPPTQPTFEVRVLDSTQTPISPSPVDLGNGSGRIVSGTDPFLQPLIVPNQTTIQYRDWSCAQIDLTAQVGKTVTVQFVTNDCAHGGHWGYAYIDNICGLCTNSPGGNISFNAGKSSTCGVGNLCFDFTLPVSGKQTGTGVITLDLYQAGTKITTLTSPNLTGTTYCFQIDQAVLSKFDVSKGGFDFTGTGTFTLAGSVTKLTVGNPPDGQTVGRNNDYMISCAPPPQPLADCCQGKNLAHNGDMNLDKGIDSKYTQVNPDQLLPGTYTLTKVESIAKACSNWTFPKACNKTQDFTGGVLLVNGLTNQPAGQQGLIYTSPLQLPNPPTQTPPLKEGEFHICFHYLPLPACCFDVVPKLNVEIKGASGPITLYNVTDSPIGCGNLFSAYFKSPGGSADINIFLAEDGRGDGNDLMIDNLSVQQLPLVPTSLLFNLQAADVGGGNYNITLTAPAGLTSPPYTWVWEIWDPTTNTNITPAGNYYNIPNTTFGNMNFQASKDYVFKLKAWSSCNALSGSKQLWRYDPNALRVIAAPDPSPEPVKMRDQSALKDTKSKEEVPAKVKPVSITPDVRNAKSRQ